MCTSVYVYQSVFIHYMCLLCRIIIIIIFISVFWHFIHSIRCLCVCGKKPVKNFLLTVQYVFFHFFHITRYIFFILSPLYFQLFSSFFLSLETNFSRPAATYTHTHKQIFILIFFDADTNIYLRRMIFLFAKEHFFFALYHK